MDKELPPDRLIAAEYLDEALRRIRQGETELPPAFFKALEIFRMKHRPPEGLTLEKIVSVAAYELILRTHNERTREMSVDWAPAYEWPGSFREGETVKAVSKTVEEKIKPSDAAEIVADLFRMGDPRPLRGYIAELTPTPPDRPPELGGGRPPQEDPRPFNGLSTAGLAAIVREAGGAVLLRKIEESIRPYLKQSRK